MGNRERYDPFTIYYAIKYNDHDPTHIHCRRGIYLLHCKPGSTSEQHYQRETGVKSPSGSGNRYRSADEHNGDNMTHRPNTIQRIMKLGYIVQHNTDGSLSAIKQGVEVKARNKTELLNKVKTMNTNSNAVPKHTPGPWHTMEGGMSVQGENPNLIQVYATGEDLEMICQVWRDGHLIHRKQDFKANARLIAAAPQLLEALQRLLACPDLNLDSLESETVEAIQHAQQVINTATNG